jgi:hypothetical protein
VPQARVKAGYLHHRRGRGLRHSAARGSADRRRQLRVVEICRAAFGICRVLGQDYLRVRISRDNLGAVVRKRSAG